MARLLVFDLDGTLVDSSRDIASAVDAALARVAPGTASIPLDATLSFVGEGARLLVERCLRHAGLGLTADEVLPVYLDCYREQAASFPPFSPPANGVLTPVFTSVIERL